MAALLASVVGVGPAGAQVSDPDPVLVSNVDNSGGLGFFSVNGSPGAALVGQAFTTGSAGNGYTVTGMTVSFYGTSGNRATVGRVSLYDDSGGLPGAELVGSNVSLVDGTGGSRALVSADFGDGVVLEPSTKYWAVYGTTSTGRGWFGSAGVRSGLGSDSLEGWSLTGGYRTRFYRQPWGSENTSGTPHPRIELTGVANYDPDPVLVSNLHHTTLANNGVNGPRLQAQAFTTGAQDAGISATGLRVGLYAVDAPIAGATAASQGRVSLHDDSGGLPGRELFGADVELEQQVGSDRSLLVEVDFGREVVLSPSTKYWVVAGLTTGTSGWWGYPTAAAGLASDSLEGWSLSGGVRRKPSGGAWGAELAGSHPHLRFELTGLARSYARAEPVGEDFAGNSSTLGFVAVGDPSSGSLSGGDVDAFGLRTEAGRRYRLEATFGGDTPPAAGAGWIQLTAGGQTLAGSTSWSDYRYPDGRAYLDFSVSTYKYTDPPKWHDADSPIPHSGVYVRVHPGAYRDSRDRDHTGAYTLTLTDITGTIKMTGNLNKFWLGGDGTGNDYGYNQWEINAGTSGHQERAGQFTTGNLTEGFELDRVETYITGITTSSDSTVVIRTDNSDAPGDTHCTLVSPAGYQNTNDDFSFPTDFFAPDTGCTLAGNTKYWVGFQAGHADASYSVAIVDTAAADTNLRPPRPKAWAWGGIAWQRSNATPPAWSRSSTDARAIQFDIIAKPKLAATHADLNPQPRTPRAIGGL